MKHADPGAPWQNGYAESFNGKLRDKLRVQEVFASLARTEILAKRRRRHYNESRPHRALGYLSPAAFAATFDPNRRRHCRSRWYEGPGPVRFASS